jgi:hypothetical protein
MIELNLISSPSFSVDYFSRYSDSLVITFGFYGQNKLSGMGWGGVELFEDGFDVLAIKTLSNDWYQCLDIKDFNAISEFLFSKNYRKKIAYGTSMGGYAAILISKFVTIDEVICFSPQFTIWESWDLRWSGEARRNSPQKYDLRNMASSNVICKIAYDPYDIDKIHFNEINKIFRNCIEYRMPNFGHLSVVCLADCKKLRDFNKIIINGLPNYTNKELYDLRKKSPFHKYSLAKKLKKFSRNTYAFNIIRMLNFEDNIDFGKLYVELGIFCELENTITYVFKLIVEEKNPHARIYLNILNTNLEYILNEAPKFPGVVQKLFNLINISVENDFLRIEIHNFMNVFSKIVEKKLKIVLLN